MAWGGIAQRGSVHVELSGTVCGACDDWPTVVEWLALWKAKQTRVDLAGDDFLGDQVSIDWAVKEFKGGGFTGIGAGGAPPKARLIDDLGSEAGKTLYVGRRENGKLCRVYEKGKSLGDPSSLWNRFEVEWRAKNRVLPYEMLLRPAEFLAGAYPCGAFFAVVKERVRTFKVRAVLSYQKAISIARLHAGRVVNMILQVSGGNVGEVIDQLRRGGLPKRVSANEVVALSGGGSWLCNAK